MIRSTWVVSALMLSGCAVLQTARMQLPDDLAARSEVVSVGSLGGGRKGQAVVDGRELRFQREASRLQLFGVYATDSAGLRYQFAGDSAECNSRRHEVQLGGISAQAPNRVECQLGAQARLAVQEVQSLARAAGPQPAGELRLAGGRVVQVLASFHLEGSPIAMTTPSGYLFREGGRTVCAADTVGGNAYLPRGDAALREACLRASIALSLIWLPD